jgi:hypothetical protein
MAVTRINNNQITDASAGNIYVGINANTKLQNYSITAGKIANNLTYGSDLTVAGNLTVQGTSTAIDTTITTIEDPVIVLASTQTGSPTVDIGFLGERGTSNNIAFVWNEASDEFVTAFTSTAETNTTITITSYANFHTNDANIGGNLVVNGTTSLIGNIAGNINLTGNITGGNLLTPGLISATGNITGGNLSAGSGTIVTTGNIDGANLNATAGVTATTVDATANITGGNLVTAGVTDTATLAVSGTSSFTGNITSPFNVTGNLAAGNISTPGLISAVGNVTGGNIITTGLTNTGTLETTGNALIGGNLIVNGNISYININDLRVEDPVIILGTGPNGAPLTVNDGLDRGVYMEYYISNVGTSNAFMGFDNSSGNMFIASDVNFTSNDIVGVNSYGTLQAGNLYIQSAVSTGNVAGGNIVTAGNVVGGNLVTAGVTDTGTLTVSGTSSFTGNITSPFNVTGNITAGNLSAGSGIILTTGNITGGNILTSGIVSAASNITAGNINTAGQLQGGNIVISGDDITDTNGRVNFNTAAGDVDFAVNGDTVANIFYVDAGTGTASFGNATQTVNSIVAFNATTSILLPVGSAGERPTGVTGQFRFNTTQNSLEVFDNSEWVSVGVPVFTLIDDQQFTGDGSTVAFTLNSTQTTNSCIVSINGVVQIPTLAYAVAGTDPSCVLTFTEAPAPGDIIDARLLTTTVTVTSISNSSGNARIGTSATAGTVTVTGNLLPTANATFNLGSPSSVWDSLYVSGNSIYIGDVILKASSGNLRVRNFDDTADAGVEGTFISTSTTSGNIQIGFNHIEATNLNGNIDLAPNGNGVVNINYGNGLQIANGQTRIYMFGANTHIDNDNLTGNIAFRVNTGNGATTTLRVLNTGSVAFTNDLIPIEPVGGAVGNNIGNIGTANSRFLGMYANTVFSRATSAQYADLAERYVADADYAPGTVLSFGGNVEVTLTSADSDRRVAGVVSSHPSYIMNSECAGEFVATVALTGRVPTSVTGTVRKGDLMVSAGNGVARAEADPRVGTVIGKALADSEGDATIEVVVGRF